MPLREVPAYARRAEAMGFAGLLVPEAVHDGFLTALLALENSVRLRVATSVVLAFPRSPMTVAYASWDLQATSGGRFALGLGAQIRANVVGRFSTSWTPPVARMRDYVGALRAIWSSWQHGNDLAYESQNYRFARMQPFFRPPPLEQPQVPVYLGAVAAGMTRLAGETADALMTHPTNTSPRYLRERVVPLLAEGTARGPKASARTAIHASTFVATGPDSGAVAAERERLRGFLGFLYSTPQYEPTLDLYGWNGLASRLRDAARAGRWEEMSALVTDEILDTLVPAAPYREIADVLAHWYGGLVESITLRMPDDPCNDAGLARVIEELADR